VEKGGISRIPEHHVRKAQFIHDYDIDRILAEAGVRVRHR
jgi:hypothetical protein